MTITSNMTSHTSSLVPPMLRSKTTILDKSLSRGKQEVSLASFALLFSETVQYCQVILMTKNFNDYCPFLTSGSVKYSP